MSENLKNTKITPAFKEMKKTVAVAFSSSNFYVPYLSVVLMSLADHASEDRNYDIVIFTQDINDYNKEALKDLVCRKNISLRFFYVSDFFKGKDIYVPRHISSVTIETYYRLLAPMIFTAYPKVIFMDSDTLIIEDISNLYDTDVSKYPLAATRELLFQSALTEGERNISEFLDTLGLKDPEKYFQAGVILFNNKYFNENNLSEKLLENIQNKKYEMVDQDALNEICQEKALLVSNRWNYAPLSEKSQHFLDFMPETDKKAYLAIKNPGIIHFIGAHWKPWCIVENKYDHIWWRYCRQTPFYEEALKRLCEYGSIKKIKDDENVAKKVAEFRFEVFNAISNVANYSKNKLLYIKYSLLKVFSLGGKRKKFDDKKQKLGVLIKHAKSIMKRKW